MARESGEKFVESYRDFKELFENETRGRDFEILTLKRPSPFLIMAPHGGYIEFSTAEIAYFVAGDRYSYYGFLGIKDTGNNRMHVSSNSYNEPVANVMAKEADTVITIHGMVRDPGREWAVVGGKDEVLRARIISELNAAGIEVEDGDQYPTLAGTRPSNICNQGRRKRGVQIELSTKLREQCMADRAVLEALKSAIDKAIAMA
ncbi:MAG: poly-gamma-glutamate hydrolase family protein [Patescibacteria group bacterium]